MKREDRRCRETRENHDRNLTHYREENRLPWFERHAVYNDSRRFGSPAGKASSNRCVQIPLAL